MQLPKELTTVTPLSKYLALSLFVLLPILAFFLGMRYSQIIYTDMLPQVAYTRGESNNTPSPSPDFSNWKTYRDNRFNFSLEYPSSLNVEKNEWGILISNNDMRFIVAVDGGLTITYDASTSQNTIVDEFPGIKNEYYHPSTNKLLVVNNIVNYNSREYQIYYGSTTGGLNEDNQETLDQVLSTFKFLN